ncbi:MAG: S8 family serine peptidase, partial [Clostridiales bacterium]|nr:S8 family serine peptidase [Clostridiales bacterium]
MPDANFYYKNLLQYPQGNMGEFEVIVKFNDDIQRVAAELDLQVEVLGYSFAILTLRPELIPYLYNYKEIEYIELPKTLSLILRESMSHACITSVHSQEGYNLSGEGVLVGIIDSGIDYVHPDFRDENGNSRILFFWDQTGSGTPPAGFFGGVEYTNSRFNFALSHDQPYEIIPRLDSIGHGTAVSGIIAGNGRASAGREYGVAPKASLGIVKLGKRGWGSFALTTEIMRALKYLSDRAQELNMPLVINLSFGTNNGSHLGNTLFESYINEISQQGKTAIVVAAGNEGSAGHHFSGHINQGQEMDVQFTVAAEVDSLFLTFWKSFVDTFDLELTTPCGERSGILNPTENFRRFNLRGTDIAVYYGQPSIYNDDQEIFILLRAAPIPQGLWTLRVGGRQVVEGEFQIWLPTTEEVGLGVSFTAPDPNFTLTLPATAEKVISVGG